jgi:O-methyltransferase
MNLTLFQIINYSLVFLLAVLFIRYLWIVYVHRANQPVQWQHAIKNGLISARLRKMERNYPDKVRFFNWWFQVQRLRQSHIPGVFVELGVYRGDSAAILHQMDPTRPFHLFDTFTGFTTGDLKSETGEAATYTTDHFADTNVSRVLKKIDGDHNIIIHQGYFPDTALGFNLPIALANLDADLYKPTRAGLELFYQNLSPGGVIMIHDYNDRWPGVMKAVNDFSNTISESLIIVPDQDGTAMIIRNK